MRTFRGEYIQKLDAKGRVSVPARFRRVLEQGDPDWEFGAQPELVLVYGAADQMYLEGFSVKSIEGIEEKISAISYGAKRDILEIYYATQSLQMNIDDNGRIILPQNLIDRLKLEDEVKFAGYLDRFQIWKPDAHQRYLDQQQNTLLSYADGRNDFHIRQFFNYNHPSEE